MPHLFGLIEEAKNLPDDCPIPRLSKYHEKVIPILNAYTEISWTSSLGSKYSKKFFTSNHWHFEAVNAILVMSLYNLRDSLIITCSNMACYIEKKLILC